MSALWEPITLGEHFLRGAEQYGDRIALSDGTQKVTYRQLVELAGLTENGCARLGCSPMSWSLCRCPTASPLFRCSWR